MRKVMTLKPSKTATKPSSNDGIRNSPDPVVRTKVSPETKKAFEQMMKTPTNEAGTPPQKTPPSTGPKVTNETLLTDTSALDKLNGLEQEHKRLTAMQSKTEDKINRLDAKIRKEAYHRKLLQDQIGNSPKENQPPATDEILLGQQQQQQQTLMQQQLQQQLLLPQQQQQGSKPKRKKPPPTRITSESKTSKSLSTCDTKCPVSFRSDTRTTKSAPSDSKVSRSSSPSHYLVDFAQIPFVVGRSTSKSHALGANIQSVLSIMKNHNMLCCDASPSSCRRRAVTGSGGGGGGHANKCVREQSELLRSCEHLRELLTTLQDEFAQIGFEHREVGEKYLNVKEPGEFYSIGFLDSRSAFNYPPSFPLP